ncbi:flagellar hook-length control protein FliK [Alteromonas sp. S015]|uniref:flagellar hook-length control protein FliK n=1 Tax=Alteromonas sp. S015 TaxID=3117401 RepID=UPI002FE2BE4E
MTTSLSSLLAATLNQSTGSTSPSPISLSSAGNVDAATHSGNRSTAPAITNTALSKAVALDNAAKAVVERVPDRLLSISISANSSDNAPSSSVKSALLALNVVLPAELNTKLSKQAINNAQLALLPQSAQGQPNAQSAVLFSTSLHQRQVSLPASDKAELIKTVAQSLANNNAAVTLKGQLSISTKSESFGQLMLTTVKNDVVPISDINTEKLDGTLKAALQKLIGQQVVIGLSRASNSGVALNISPELSTGNVNPSVNRDNLATIDHKNVSTNLQLQLISSALKQGGVAVEHNSDNTSRLSALLESSGANTNALKVLSALTLTNDKLSVRTTQQTAFLQINLPQGSAPSLSIPTLTQEQINKLNLTQLPNVTAKGFETISESGVSVNSPPTADVKTEVPTSLKGTEVHNAITALSRILLSQTGSTNQALSQLIAIIENGKFSSNTGATNAINLPPFDKILMQLKGVDALNAKPSQAKVFNGEFIGPPKPSSEQLQAMAKAALIEKESAISGEASSMQGEDMANKPSLVSLASLAQAFSTQAKGLSNTLVNNIFQQLAAMHSKGAEVSPTITDSQVSLANSKTNEAIVGESVSAIDEVKNSTKKLALDMNDQGLSQRLQQLLSTQALVTTPLNLTSPANSSNFVQGLIALVQLALAGRAMQRQPSLKSQIDAPDSFVSKTLANMGVSSQPSRLSQDINQLDSRHQMLAQLKTLLSSHQQNKIANVDSRIQGQESFYYILPSFSQHQNPPELLIKREYAGQQNKHAPTDQRAFWNITMKLDIGDSGKVLAKSKIDKSTITLDLYASNDEILRRIGDTLPYLRKRLTSLGLAVENTSYQRGHIPDTLNSRPHQIFETRV